MPGRILTSCLLLLTLPAVRVALPQTDDVYRQATQAIQSGSTDRAIDLLNVRLKTAPQDEKALNLLGIAYMTSGRRTEADSALRQALTVSPNFLPAMRNLALNEFAWGKLEDAETHFEKILQLSPKDPLAHLYLGEIAFSRQDYNRALPLYQLSEGLESRDPLIALHFAQTYLEFQKREPALAVLKSIAPSEVAPIQFRAGILFSQAGEDAAALRAFERAKKDYPDRYQLGFNIVLTCEKLRAFDEAIAEGEELLSAGYRKAELYNLLGIAYEQSGATQKAYDSLRAATELEPKSESSYLDLIALALQHRNLDLSLQISDIALANLPGSYRIALAKGAVLAMAGRPTEAEDVFRKTTQVSPGESAPYLALAMVEIQSGKLDQAINLLRARAKLSPDDYLVNFYLGEAVTRKGSAPNSAEDREAEAALLRAERAKPEAATPHALRGKLLFARGDMPKAAAEFENALRLNPHDCSPAYQLSMIYRKRGDAESADAMLNLWEKNKKATADEAMNSSLLDVLRTSGR